eukprot:m.97736 g.97736  ORF g.97736 m.97736 type:complete len:1006 (+) comp13611_c0_seq2:54-3071(+)
MMDIQRVTMLLTLCVIGVVVAAPREELTFNFGWKFHLGDPAGSQGLCPSNAFDTSISTDCTNTIYSPVHSAEDCRKACCPGSGYHPNCSIWTWCSSNDPAHYKENVTCGCYLGDHTSECPGKPSKIKWSGGKRTSPWPKYSGAPFSDAEFDDSTWATIDVPHDFVIEGDFNENATDYGKHGYLPREQPGWYRKSFNIPDDWLSSNKTVWLRFNGVFHTTQAWLDGDSLALTAGSLSGYTAFVAQISNLKKQHVLALRVDASFGSGHWYEGGGIYRDSFIIATNEVHFTDLGVAAPPAATLQPTAEVINESGEIAEFTVAFDLFDTTGNMVASLTTKAVPVEHGETITVSPNASFKPRNQNDIWALDSPVLFTMVASLMQDGTLLDSVNITTAFRDIKFTADSGFFLNGNRHVLRGFSNHNDMAGVGAAVPQRMNLFRAQMLRAVGGNIWRMSHNPGDPKTFDIFDRIGVLSWDENRDYGKFQAVDMADMVRRDRNHPSIIIWSMCNEIECTEQNKSQGEEYRALALKYDTSRPISGNLLHDSSPTMVNHFDVLGISHASTVPSPWTPLPAGWYDPRYSYQWFHEHHPTIPMVSSESTSCNTQRGVNVVDENKGEWDDVFNADCLSKLLCPAGSKQASPFPLPGVHHKPGSCEQSWTQAYFENGTIFPFMAGNLGIWTLFDYIGEPTSENRVNPCRDSGTGCNMSWPQVSCNFGSFDLAGFAKPAAYFYRTWWLANIPLSDPSRPPVAGEIDIVKIVHDWREPAPPIVAIYTNLPQVELFLNGRSLGKHLSSWANWTQWNVAFEPGNLTAVGYDNAGNMKETDTKLTPGEPAGVALSLDVPSLATGTGSSLYLDGQDAGMVRVSVVDKQGNVVTGDAGTNINVSFSILSGPGRIIGVGNGDPTCHERNKATWRTTYHGLCRAIVQVTAHSSGDFHSRKRISEIDVHGGVRTKILLDENQTQETGEIVVLAVADGFSANISIPVSSDYENSVDVTATHSNKVNIMIP